MRGRIKGFVCSQITRDKMSVSHTGMKFTDEHKKMIGISTRVRWLDPNYRKSLEQSDSRKAQIGLESKKRWEDPIYVEMMRTKLQSIANDPEYIARMREKYWDELNYKKSRSKTTKKLWQNSEYAKMMLRRRTPNGPEKKVIEILKSMVSDIKYVGNGTFTIKGMNPDFVNEDKKQIIEVFGCYWHCCKKCRHPNRDKRRQKNVSRIKRFNELGYSVLIIWEHELRHPDSVINKVNKFVNAL